MRRDRLIFSFFFIIVFCIGCTQDAEPGKDEDWSSFLSRKGIKNPPERVTLVHYEKEGELEVRVDSAGYLKPVVSYPTKNRRNYLHVGLFRISGFQTSGLSYDFPNSSYKTKTGRTWDFFEYEGMTHIGLAKEDVEALKELEALRSPEEILLLPSRLKQDTTFKKCLRCPHWMPEMYDSALLQYQAMNKK